MSFGDPNDNPYRQPPGQVPPPPPNQPGYGYPQQPQGQPGYGYPQQPPAYPGYPGYPGANVMQPSMPGLLMTARVFLFLIGAVQIMSGIFCLYLAAIANDAANSINDSSPFELDIEAGRDAVVGYCIIATLICAALATLSITLGVKFSRGAQGVRITTAVYGIIGGLVGLLLLFQSAGSGTTAIIFPLMWVIFAIVITVAPLAPSGTAWFARPRY